MKLEADPKRIQQLAHEREDDNWCFRLFLKGVELEIEELDAIAHRHHQAGATQIDCCACGNCCREISPVLSGYDVTRLATGLRVSKPEVIQRYLQPDKEEEDSFTFRDTPCPLLSGNMCTVYEFRPEDCRSFPHLHKEEFVFRLIQAVQNCAVCPIVFHVFERLKDELWHEPNDVWEEDEEWYDSAEQEDR